MSPIAEEKPIISSFSADKMYTVLDYTSFDSLGTWELQQDSGTLLPSFLYSSTKSTGDADNAKAVFGVTADDVYDVWVHTKDATANPGTSSFYLSIDSNDEIIAGGHGQDGWHWDKIASYPLFAGEHTMTLRDYRGNFSRVDMILITNDHDFAIGENQSVMEKLQRENLYQVGTAVQTKAADSGETRPTDEIAVQFNGKYMTFDVPPLLINDRTMVPMRAIFEALGCMVSWNDDTQTATGERNGSTVSLTIGSAVGRVDGEAVALDAPAALINDRTMIPLRFVSESLGAVVQWEAESNTVRILAEIPKGAYFLRPESFDTLGTWFMESGQSDAFNGITLRGLVKPEDNPQQTEEDYNNPQPATVSVSIAKEGSYRIWVHAKDFETNGPGTRYFNIGVNNTMVEQKFGTHGKNGYFGADAGVFDLEAGVNTVSLYDTSKFYARCDGILLVEDLEYVPAESYALTVALAKPYTPSSTQTAEFPVWAKSTAQPTDFATIENAQTRVVFYKVPTDNGMIVQNEIYAMHNGNWVKTNDRTEPLGYLLMQANSSLKAGTQAEIAAFKNTYTVNGITKDYIGEDVYKAGNASWLIPTDYTVEENKATLYFGSNSYVDFAVVWELDNDRSPKVTIQASFKQDGAYSIGSFEGGGFTAYDFAMIPYRVMSKQVAKDRGLTTQQSAMTPMVTYTLGENNAYTTEKVTKGIVVDPAWLPIQWNYTENNRFGLSAIDASGAFSGGVFAPLFGTDDCLFKAGDSYDFSYRVISEVSDWYDSYKHIAMDLFEVTDYRSNYYTSLNEAIYNTVDLMMDDDLGGWNVYAKSFYNMESSYIASNANPMALLQAYQLTESQEILERRTIPTIANLLTRPDFHMNWTTNAASQNWAKHEIGTPIRYFNLNVMGGVYEQTGGTLPWLLNYAIEKAKDGTVNETASAVAPFMNNLHLYKYTGEKQYLDKAVQAADEYLETVVYAPKTEQLKETVFVYAGYYPSLSSLLDIYDVTGDKKYLDAAEYTGRWLSAMVQTAGVDSTKRNTIIHVNEPEDVAVRWHGDKGEHLSSSFWWHGDVIWRQGTTPPGNPADTDAAYAKMREYVEDVPLWVASNVGLGVEQPTTFGGSSYMTMSCWAGDMVRLAYLTGDSYFESVARNAIVGRFGGYSGYYLQRFWTYYMQPEYAFNGPDFTNIYWHHIPEFYSMLCDFLVNQIGAKTDYKVTFPALRQQGYAYFDSNQYGYAAGSFYDEADMWLWLDRGIVEPDSVQIDYLAARKDGVLGVSFLNEGNETVTTTITLGDKIPNGATYNGTAVLYENGQISETEVQNGSFSLTVAPKCAVSVKLSVPGLKAPSYANMHYTLNGDYAVDQTVSEHENGKGFVLQMSPDAYYAYVYVTDTEETTSAIRVIYKIADGAEQTAEMSVYPYEVIIPVYDASAALTYRIELVQNGGSVKKIKGGTLKPLQAK